MKEKKNTPSIVIHKVVAQHSDSDSTKSGNTGEGSEPVGAEPPCENASGESQDRGPVVFEVDSVSKEKMEAITSLSQAILELAVALNSVNTSFTLQNLTVNGAPGSPCISISQKGL